MSALFVSFSATLFSAALLLCPPLAVAGVITNSPSLPPQVGSYVTPGAVHACFAAGLPFEVCLSQGNHHGFANITTQFLPGNEIESFNSTFTGQLDRVTPPQPLGPVTMNGPVTVKVIGRTGPNATGAFDTEMLQLDLSGNSGLGPLMIRESPTLPSLGRTTITPLGGGQFQIDSFFDIFTELSIDGGQSWIPSTGSTRVELQPNVPEPGSLLLAAAGLALGVYRLRRRA